MIMDSESNLLTAKEPPREIIVDDKVKLVLNRWYAPSKRSCREFKDFPEPNNDICNAIKQNEYFKDDKLRQAICIKQLGNLVLIIEEYEDMNISYYYKLSSASS